MNTTKKTPIVRSDDSELLGYVVSEAEKWYAATLFGYIFKEAVSEDEAETLVRSRGLDMLTGVWQYYDEKDDDWKFCIIKEASPKSVTIIKTNYMGYQDAATSDIVTLDHPATSLRK
jgi:hypothetical protein